MLPRDLHFVDVGYLTDADVYKKSLGLSLTLRFVVRRADSEV
jgi:hypothetical protein